MSEESRNNTPQQRARRAFEHLISGEDKAIDLAQAALLIAAEEYPDLDIAGYLSQLDLMAGQVCILLGLTAPGNLSQLPPQIDPQDAIAAISKVLFEQEHFSGNQLDYYNPCNSFLNDVLEKRKGIPLTLSIIYMEVGKRIGMPIVGIGLPFHFIVRCNVPPGNIYVDPFERGRLLSEQDCRERVIRMLRGKTSFNPHWMEPVSHRQILVRMLANLKNINISSSDYTRALSVCNRILLLFPHSAIERRDRGIVYLHLKRYARALRDFRAYVELAPNAEDLKDIQQQIRTIRQIITMMN